MLRFARHGVRDIVSVLVLRGNFRDNLLYYLQCLIARTTGE
jgi:hypothetical protein